MFTASGHTLKSRLFAIVPASWVLLTATIALAALLITPNISAFNGWDDDRRDDNWVATWGASQQSGGEAVFGPPPMPAHFSNQTLRITARISRGGDRVRVRLDNRFGTDSLTIGAVHIAKHSTGASIEPGSDRTLKFGARPTITIPPGASVVSDPVRLPVADLTELAVSIYLPNPTSALSVHTLGVQTTYISGAGAGDLTDAITIPTPTTARVRYFLSGIDVRTDAETKAIVTLGDSITDGYGVLNQFARWPDFLTLAIQNDPQIADTRSVLNFGMGANGLLGGGQYQDSGVLRVGREDAHQLDLDHTVVWREFHRVRQDVDHDLLQPFRVGQQQRNAALDLGDDPHVLLVGRRSHLVRPPASDQLLAPVGDTHVRTEELVRRADEHVGVPGPDVDCAVWPVVHGVDPGKRTCLVRELAHRRHIRRRADRRIVDLEYRDRDGQVSSRAVEAHGLHLGYRGSYLLGWCRMRDAGRAFRLDRIVSVRTTPEVAPERDVDSLLDWLDDAVADMGTAFPVMFADSFLATAMTAEMYYALIDVPENIDDFILNDLGIDVEQNSSDQEVIRAGFSGASIGLPENAFLAERHDIEVRNGVLWQIADFGGGPDGLFEDPLGQPRGERKLVFTLPNGLLGFALAACGPDLDNRVCLGPLLGSHRRDLALPHGDPLDQLLNVGSFDLDRILEIEPDFLECAASGGHGHHHGEQAFCGVGFAAQAPDSVLKEPPEALGCDRPGERRRIVLLRQVRGNDVPEPRALERRDEVLRLRIYRPADGGAAWSELGWKGRKRERAGYRHRPEWETRVADADAAGAILERLGYDVSLKIDRRVTQLGLGGAVIRIEWYPEMDVLVEIEGGPDDIERAIRATGLPRDAFLPKSLPHFMRAYERRTGRRARLAHDAR